MPVEIARSAAWTLFGAANVPATGRVGLAEEFVLEDASPAQLWLAYRTDPAPATRSLIASPAGCTAAAGWRRRRRCRCGMR